NEVAGGGARACGAPPLPLTLLTTTLPWPALDPFAAGDGTPRAGRGGGMPCAARGGGTLAAAALVSDLLPLGGTRALLAALVTLLPLPALALPSVRPLLTSRIAESPSHAMR